MDLGGEASKDCPHEPQEEEIRTGSVLPPIKWPSIERERWLVEVGFIAEGGF